MPRWRGQAVTDELIGLVVGAVRPVPPSGHGDSWQVLLAHDEQVTGRGEGGDGQDPMSIVKIEELLVR